MRRARVTAVACFILSVTGVAPLAGIAHADATDLYVDKASAQCSDTAGTAGAKATPFCTIAAATKAVQPGQTVHIGYGYYNEPINLTTSGTPQAPITFVGDTEDPLGRGTVLGEFGTLDHAVALSGVHDVVIDHLFARAGREAVLVTDSSRVTVSHTMLYSSGWSTTDATAYPSLRITGASADVTVSRDEIDSSHAGAVQIDAGVARTVVTTNMMTDNAGRGVLATDAPGTVVTSNTIHGACGAMVELAGASGGSVVENNVLDENDAGVVPWGFCTAPVRTDLAVSIGSAAGTKADYNLVTTAAKAYYTWAGQSYPTVAGFQQVTGQGAHDLTATQDQLRKPNSPAVDSADADAPGELATDFYGNPRVDDPAVPNTGTGVGYYDRGAAEEHDSLGVSLTPAQAHPDGKPLTVVFNGVIDSPWTPATGTLDFGDGSAPATVTAFPVTHDYAQGTYTATLTATDGLGLTRKTTATVVVAAPGPIVPSIPLIPYGTGGLEVTASASATSPWPVAQYSLDFGDGTAPVVTATAGNVTHHYAKPGSYTVTLTITDDHGRSAVSSSPVAVSTPVFGRWAAGQQISTVGYYRDGRFSLLPTNAHTNPMSQVGFGEAGDTPVVGDWDGAGYDQVGIFRASSNTFGVRHADGSVTAVPMGNPGDIPVPGKWDGNGHAQLAVYRPASGLFIVRHDDGSYSSFVFGNPGDVPLVGDFDGSGHVQAAIWRAPADPTTSGTFAVRHDDGSISTAAYGGAGDIPVVGDWAGVGRVSYGVYRPATGVFYLSQAYVRMPDISF